MSKKRCMRDKIRKIKIKKEEVMEDEIEELQDKEKGHVI